MTLSVWFSLLLAVSLCFVNVGVVGWVSERLSNAVPSKLLNEHDAQHTRAAAAKKQKPSDNIRGSKLVHIVPPTLLKLNPNATAPCLDTRSEAVAPVFLPIRVKGVPPFEMVYEHIAFNGERSSHTVAFGEAVEHPESVSSSSSPRPSSQTGQPEKRIKSRIVLDHNLPVSAPGVYRALSVRELDTETQGRVIPTLSMIVACPDISLKLPSGHYSSEGASREDDVCLGSETSLELVASGSPPFTAVYSRRAGRESPEEYVVDLNSESLEYGSLNTGIPPSFLVYKSDGLESDVTSLLQSGQQRQVAYSVNVKFDRALPNLYRLLRVTDAFGNVRKVDEYYSAEVHDLPNVAFDDCRRAKIRDEPGSSANLPVVLRGTPPFSIQLEFEDPSSEDGVLKAGTFVVSDLRQGRDLVSVGHSGVYTIKSVQDAYCSRKVESSCVVSNTVAPSVEVASQPIEQFCVGTIGMLGMILNILTFP